MPETPNKLKEPPKSTPEEEKPVLPVILSYTPSAEEIEAIKKLSALTNTYDEEKHAIEKILTTAIEQKHALLLEYLLLPKDQWVVLGAYLDRHKDDANTELTLSEFKYRDDLFFDQKNTLENERNRLKEAVKKEVAEKKTASIVLAHQTIRHAMEEQNSRDQTKYIAKSVASVSGVIIGAAIGSLLIPIPGLGTAIGAAVGGFVAWKGFGSFLSTGTAKVAPEKLAMASGLDWGTIIGAAIGTLLLPGIGTAIGAAAGCFIGGAGSYFSAKNIEHKTSKVVTNISTALGGIVGGFIGAVFGTLFFPGLGTAAGAAIGSAVGAALFGGGTYLGFKMEKQTEETQKLDAPLKMAAAGGIAGATTGAGIGALIGSIIFPGVGTVAGAAIGAVVGMLGVGGASYAATKKRRGLAFSAGVGAASGAAFGAAIGTVIFPGIGTAIGAGIGLFVGAISGVVIKKTATWGSKAVVMGVTGAVGGAKIGSQVGAGIGGFLGLLIGGPPGLALGMAAGGAIGALVGAITFGLGRALLGRFKEKRKAIVSGTEGTNAVALESTPSTSDTQSVTKSAVNQVSFDQHQHNAENPSTIVVKRKGANEEDVKAALAKVHQINTTALGDTMRTLEQHDPHHQPEPIDTRNEEEEKRTETSFHPQ